MEPLFTAPSHTLEASRALTALYDRAQSKALKVWIQRNSRRLLVLLEPRRGGLLR